MNAGATWSKPNTKHLLMISNQTCGLCRNLQATWFCFLFSLMQCCKWHSQACEKLLENTYMNSYTHPSKKNQQACKHAHTLLPSYWVVYACKNTVSSSWLPTHTKTMHHYARMHTHIHNILHNRMWKDVCMRWQKLWFAVSAGRMWKHGGDTRNSKINKLRKEEEGLERGRQQSPNNEVGGGESLGNSGITFPPNSSSTGSTCGIFLCLIFPFEKGGSVDTTENWACFKALKTPTAWKAEAKHGIATAFQQSHSTAVPQFL